MTATARTRSGVGLAARLLVALAVVLVTAAVTAWVVGAAVGPRLFHEHMIKAGLDDHDAAVVHAEEAFRAASTTAAALALVAAAIAATAASLVVARRIAGSLDAVAAAAADLGAGDYGVRVPTSGLGAEFEQLTTSFNALADRLEESQHLRERLLADVAHEIRTPVATIRGYVEAITDGVQELDATTADVLLGQAERLSRLARDLAAVTHAEAGDITLDLEPIQPEQLVDAAVHAWAERAATAGVDVRARAERPLPAVLVDQNRMAQVLDNLLANALRHTPSGGRITLRASRRDDQVCLEVSDTGTGIAAEHLPHVFERFYRAETARDRDSGGSGIGLAISKALVEAQGGTIHVASPGVDGGATFTITLPAASEV